MYAVRRLKCYTARDCNCNISLKLSGHVFTVFTFSDMTLHVFQLFTQDLKENL